MSQAYVEIPLILHGKTLTVFLTYLGCVSGVKQNRSGKNVVGPHFILINLARNLEHLRREYPGFGVWGLGFGVWEIGRAHV